MHTGKFDRINMQIQEQFENVVRNTNVLDETEKIELIKLSDILTDEKKIELIKILSEYKVRADDRYEKVVDDIANTGKIKKEELKNLLSLFRK